MQRRWFTLPGFLFLGPGPPDTWPKMAMGKQDIRDSKWQASGCTGKSINRKCEMKSKVPGPWEAESTQVSESTRCSGDSWGFSQGKVALPRT